METPETQFSFQSMNAIKNKITQRFGKIFDEHKNDFINIPFDSINLVGHCGEVSRITQETIGGVIREHRKKGSRPSVSYLYPNGKKIEIASGFTEAIHSYTIDKEGKVWDPTTNNWGSIKENDYLKMLV